MRQLRIFIFFISCTGFLHAQETESLTVEQDSVKRITTYGLRVGADLSKVAYAYLDDDNKGFEIIGDIGFKPNLYAAVELGYMEKTSEEDYINFMQNEIYIGFRYALGFFSHTLNNYTPNMYGSYFNPDEVSPGTEFEDLDAHWFSIIVGIKVETLKNLYLGMNVSVNRLIKSTEPENFMNLYIPGFNRVYSNDVGAGFNYSISYMIPLLKKER